MKMFCRLAEAAYQKRLLLTSPSSQEGRAQRGEVFPMRFLLMRRRKAVGEGEIFVSLCNISKFPSCRAFNIFISPRPRVAPLANDVYPLTEQAEGVVYDAAAISSALSSSIKGQSSSTSSLKRLPTKMSVIRFFFSG
jgi:hypothetical protein